MRFSTFQRYLPCPLLPKASSIVGLVPTAVLLLFFVLGSQAYPQSYSTNNGAWSSAATWNTPPVNGLSAIVTGSNTVTFSTGTYTSGGWDAGKYLAVGWNAGPNPGAGILNITGGTLNADGLAMGHESRTGTINQSGGIFNVYGVNTLIGWGAASTINVSGGTMNMTGGAGTFRLGHSSTASLNVSGTGVANLSGTIGLAAGGSQINVNGGTLNISNATVSFAANTRLTARSNGVINMLAGTQTIGVGEALYLGTDATTGTLNLSGGTWTQNSFVRMGVFTNGNGIINQTGGTFGMGSTFEAWGSSPAAYNLSGGTFRTLTNGVQINSYSGGPMTFNITGSSGNVTMDTPFDFTAPNSSVFNNAAATLTKTGAGKLTVSGQLDVRNGILSMQNGTLETVTATVIGSSSGNATATMTNGTLRIGYLGGGNFAVGNTGATGTFTQSGGTNQLGSQANAVIGWNTGTGTYTLNGGTFTGISNITFVGIAGTGTLNVSGGTYSGYNTLIGHSAGSGTVNVGSGSFTSDFLIIGGNNSASGTLNLNGGTFGVNQTFVVDTNGTINVNTGGALSGGASGNLTVQNGGVVKFNGGTGNGSMNLLLNGGIVDISGQSIATNGWANLVASRTGSILRNSSTNAATITAGNTIWIWNNATNLTIDASGGNITIDSRITSSDQPNPTGIIKTGTNNLVLTYANDYTGTTAINEGRLALANGNALGSTAGGTVVASGAQLLLTNVVVVAEPLTISGNGLPSGSAIAGALRSLGTNTYQGKITLGANAKIFGGSGTSLTVDVASGDAVDLSGNTLTIDGAGSLLINDGITGAGGLTKEGSGAMTLAGVNTYTGTTTVSLGTLVVSNASLSASILPNSVGVVFASAPIAGTYDILPGALAGNSLSSQSVTGLSSGQTATVANSPNLVVQVTDAPTGPTFDSLYTPGSENGLGSNGLPNLMNYALGGNGPSSTPALPVLTSDANSLTLTANIRNSGQGVNVVGQYAYDLAGPWNDVTLNPTGASSSLANTTVQYFTQPVESNKPRKFLRFKVTKQ
jgi:fibronectin-binding autotransporter adhesin